MSKKTKAKKENKKKLDISALAIIDNIVFSKKEIWAYYRIQNSVYDFLSTDAKISLAARTSNAFTAIVAERNQEVDGHLILTSTPINIDLWEEQVLESTRSWDTAENFDNFIKQQVEFLEEQGFMRKVTYMGIKLGNRGALDGDSVNIFEEGFKETWKFIKKWGQQALRIPGEEIDAFEESVARQKEKSLYNIIAHGNLQAEKVSAEELLLLIKREFYPNMPTPYLDVDHDSRLGPGDLILETTSVIKNKYRYLEFEQAIGRNIYRGYRATLSFSNFPKFMNYPDGVIPFFYLISRLGLPFTSYARFTLKPSQGMKKELEKKKKEARDEIGNLQSGMRAEDAAFGAPAGTDEALEDMQTMESMLNNDKSPWVEGSYRIVVETPSEESLKASISLLKQQYNDMDINLTWTAGDQADLFLEQMPGDYLRMKSFNQITNVQMLGTSGFNFDSIVGDKIYGTDMESVVEDN